MVTSVKTPLTFFEKPVKILFLDAVKFPQVSFGLIPKILNAIDVILLVCKKLGMINPQVMECRYIQRII